MLSFQPKAIEQWLSDQPGGRSALPTGFSDETLPTVQLALARLAEGLEKLRGDELGKRLSDAGAQTSLRSLASHLSTGVCLRLLTWLLDAAVPTEVLLDLFDPAAEPAGAADKLCVDVRRLHRLALLETIFAPERIARVRAACDRGKR